MTTFLFLAGSTRTKSFNKRLAHVAEKIARDKGVQTEFIDLADYDMPMFNEDLEASQGLPAATIALKKKFEQCDGFFLACPEYNGFITPLLKNTIDWMSRKATKDEASAFKGKVAALGSTSPGGLGGLRGLVTVRMLLGNLGVHVVPTQVAIGNAMTAFNDDDLINEPMLNMLHATLDEFIQTTKALHA